VRCSAERGKVKKKASKRAGKVCKQKIRINKKMAYNWASSNKINFGRKRIAVFKDKV
jgi:hypothetical protein